jgi:dual-specificity kinase
MCVYDFLKENDFAPFPRRHIQDFARQLLGSVACMCMFLFYFSYLPDYRIVLHDLHLIHTDLKPENILLVTNDHRTAQVPVPGKVRVSKSDIKLVSDLPLQRNAPPRSKRILQSTEIRLIDFGSATFEQEYHSTVVSTRHYRAPEIILGLS